MADVTTFYPGGSIQHPVPVSERVDDQGSAAEIFFWSGTQTAYEAIRDHAQRATMYPDFNRTIYYTTT